MGISFHNKENQGNCATLSSSLVSWGKSMRTGLAVHKEGQSDPFFAERKRMHAARVEQMYRCSFKSNDQYVFHRVKTDGTYRVLTPNISTECSTRHQCYPIFSESS